MSNLLSKINIGGVLYDLKDAWAREQIASLSGAAAGFMTSSGIFAGDQAVKDYVDAQVGAINKFDVAVVEELPTASEDTMYILYLVSNGNVHSGEYIEYITIRSGEEGSYTYKMEQIGTTKMDLADYVTIEGLNQALGNYTMTADLGGLALKDSATGTVAGETISGVKATGTSTGSIKVELEATEKDVASNGKFTPAGSVTGTVATAGTINVTAKHSAADAILTKGDYTPAGSVTADFSHSATAATLTKGDYTPAGDVSVALSGATFNAITGVGSQAQFTEGTFTAATLDYEAVEKNVAKEGIVGSVDGETLTFTAAGLEAISASKVTGFTGGSKAADTFVTNSLPTMAEQTVGVQSASFSGTKAEGALVTGVSYDKAALANLAFTGTKAEGALVTGVSYDKADIDKAEFTGATVDINAAFAGTEGDIAVAGKCHDYAVKTAEFNGAAIELAVGDITISDKEVTVE